jgi:uncharacterized protein YkwD
MYSLLLTMIVTLVTSVRTEAPARIADTISPFSVFSTEWNKPMYRTCNTAEQADYLTSKEKNTIYILNLARQYPQLFLQTVVLPFPDYSAEEKLRQSDYYKSLVATLRQKKPLPILYPDQSLFQSARCHAQTSGQSGYVGHNRQNRTCKDVKRFGGECCDYGSDDPLTIVMDLLIDEGIPDLGHRQILFSPYTKIAVSIQPHKKYRWNAVLDLE